VGADVVTAGGQLVRASVEQNPELLWGLRGGGGNFGVVTAFEFGLVPLGPQVYGGVALYPAEEAGDVLRAYRDWAAGASEDVTTILLLRRNAFPWSPAETLGRAVLGIGALYAGDASRGEAVLAPLAGFGTVLANSFATRRFTQHQAMLDASAPAGRLYYWKSHYMAALSDVAIDVIVGHAWRFSSPFSFTLLSHMGGAIRDVSDAATAFTGRDAEFAININCAATEPGLFDVDRAWVREWFDTLAPHSTGGVYVNFVSEDAGNQARAAYGEEKLRRLGAVKAKFDPDNVFRVNQNILPG
jgi:FAD/FMN-containing dehydrogenase